MTRSIEILPSLTELIPHASAVILDRLNRAVQARGIATIALSGGSTPKPLYQLLSQANFPWEKLHIFWGDERYVPSDHPDSNEKMAREAWLDHIAIPAENIHAVPTHLANPADAATKYEETLKQVLNISGDTVPALDVILLGMGDDAHTASLFPHTPALNVCDRLVTTGEKSGQPRITFTIPLINQGHCVLFLLAGRSKQPALANVFAPTADPNFYPSRFITPPGECIWMMDFAAGEGILGMQGVTRL
jgi:6-phosphogluconolactonase